MKAKIVTLTVSLLTVFLLISFGVVFAAKPIEVSSTLVMDCTSLVNTKVVGNIEVSDRILVGSFTGGNFEGDVYREVTILLNLKTRTPNPLVYPENQVGITDQKFIVTNARVSVDGIVAVGEFEMCANGKIGNVKWHISDSDMTIESTDEPVKMHGNGIITIISVIPLPLGPPPPPFYTITNGIIGQVSFT